MRNLFLISLEFTNMNEELLQIEFSENVYFYTEKQKNEFVDLISKLAFENNFSFILDYINNN